MSVPTEPIPGQTSSEKQTKRPRPREEINMDIESVETELESLVEETEPIREKIEDLPGGQRELINRYALKISEDVSEEDFPEIPSELKPLANEVKIASKTAADLEARMQRLHQELIPYKKKDFEDLTRELSARVDYEKVFSYYRDEEHREGPADLIDNVAEELFNLRKYQVELLRGGEGVSRNFGFYSRACLALETYKEEWGEKEFLTGEPREDYKFSREWGESVSERRRELVEYMKPVLKELERYAQLARIYQLKISFSSPYDRELEAILRILSSQNDRLGRDFEEIDFDPRFIEAAKKHVNQVVEEHKRLGHLPSEEKLKDKVEPINIEIKGFEPPEGMVSVVNSQEIFDEIKNYVPPGFLEKLKAVVHRERPESIEDEEGIETIGGCRPFYDENKQLLAVEVEIYRSPFLSETSSEAEQAFLRADLLDDLWHELGHNAHHLMRFEELVAWEEAIAEDDIAVSRYVKRARAKSEIRGKREDFSETFALFISNPAQLNISSPARFGFMLDFFNQNLSADQREAFGRRITGRLLTAHFVWDKAGITAEDVRQYHLSHLE